MAKYKIIEYHGGVGLERVAPLPVSGITYLPGFKKIRMHRTDADEILKGGSDATLHPDNASFEIDFLNPEQDELANNELRDMLAVGAQKVIENAQEPETEVKDVKSPKKEKTN